MATLIGVFDVISKALWVGAITPRLLYLRCGKLGFASIFEDDVAHLRGKYHCIIIRFHMWGILLSLMMDDWIGKL